MQDQSRGLSRAQEMTTVEITKDTELITPAPDRLAEGMMIHPHKHDILQEKEIDQYLHVADLSENMMMSNARERENETVDVGMTMLGVHDLGLHNGEGSDICR